MSEQKEPGAPRFKSFDDLYERYCALVEESLQKRLARPLSEPERQSLRDVGSMLLLEAWERSVEVAGTPAEVEEQMGALAEMARQQQKWRQERPERQ